MSWLSLLSTSAEAWESFEDDVLRIETLIEAGLIHEAQLIARALARQVSELADGPLIDDIHRLLLAVADA